MRIAKERLVSLLKGLRSEEKPKGYPEADRWDEARLGKKLRQLPAVVAAAPKGMAAASPEDQAQLDEILAAAEKGEKLELDGPAGGNGEASANGQGGTAVAAKPKAVKKPAQAAKAAKVAPAAAKKAKKAAPAAAGAERDRFGNRVGTQAAHINAALGAKGQTAAEVAAKAGIEVGRTRSHLKWLKGRGHVEVTDGAYTVAKK